MSVGTHLAESLTTMLKKLIAASTILGVAALLQNKERRERVMSTAKDLLQGARDKVGKLETKAKDAASTASESMTDRGTGAGATTRSAVPPFRTSY